jgi:hypothetical protein
MNKNTAQRISRLIKEALSKPLSEDKCNCGCHSCENVGNKGPVLNENLGAKIIMTENMQYHVTNKLPITENTFRYGSEAFLNLWAEARKLHEQKAIHLNDEDKELVTETDLGKFGMFENKKVPLDLLMEEIELEEADKKKNPPLGKPHRGGSKKFYVYVRDPKSKRIKKVSFGMAGGGLHAKLNNPKARQAFSKRHNCPQKKDKTKASYWSCRLPRYAKLLGIKTTFSGYW